MSLLLSDGEKDVPSDHATQNKDSGVTDSLISILIINWNTRELVIKCLDSLRDSFGDFPVEVIVVDNGSIDGSGDDPRAPS